MSTQFTLLNKHNKLLQSSFKANDAPECYIESVTLSILANCLMSLGLRHIHLCIFSSFVNWRPPCRIRIHRHFVSPLKVSTCVLSSTCKVGSERILY